MSPQPARTCTCMTLTVVFPLTCPPVGHHGNPGRPFYFAQPVAPQPTCSSHPILATSHGNIVEKIIDSITLYISSEDSSAVTENKSGRLVPGEILSHCIPFTNNKLGLLKPVSVLLSTKGSGQPTQLTSKIPV